MPRFDNVGKALRLLRRRDGRTQVQLARAAGISAAMLSNYEKGTKVPTLGSLGKVVDALGFDLQELDEALDVVNDRGRHGEEDTTARQPEDPFEAMPPFLAPGGVLVPDLEVALYEISRGVDRIQRHAGGGAPDRGPRRSG